VKWFRAHAARDRACEEVQILTEEFKRTKTSFRKMEDVWRELAEGHEAGYAAYAFEKSSMYGDFADDCEKAYQSIVLGKTPSKAPSI